jgi:hypothetical protein
VKLYSYHRYVVIDEIEYELDATKVTASVRYAQKLWIGDFVRHAVYLPEKVTQRAGALTPVGRIHRYVQSTSGQDGA